MHAALVSVRIDREAQEADNDVGLSVILFDTEEQVRRFGKYPLSPPSCSEIQLGVATLVRQRSAW